MPKKTDKTIILLNFDDPNNPWKDECGYTWTAYGKAHLEYDLNIMKNVVCFNRTTHDYLLSNININLGNIDFTIDGTAYMSSDSINTNYSRIFEINTSNKKGRIELLRNGNKNVDNFELDFEAFNTSGTSIFAMTTKNVNFKNEWFHFAITYEKSTQMVRIFSNGKFCVESSFSKMNSFYFNYITLGSSLSCPDRRLTGKIGYFRITKEILYTGDFDPKSEIIEPIYFNTERNVPLYTNTKRLLDTYCFGTTRLVDTYIFNTHRNVDTYLFNSKRKIFRSYKYYGGYNNNINNNITNTKEEYNDLPKFNTKRITTVSINKYNNTYNNNINNTSNSSNNNINNTFNNTYNNNINNTSSSSNNNTSNTFGDNNNYRNLQDNDDIDGLLYDLKRIIRWNQKSLLHQLNPDLVNLYKKQVL